MSDSEGERGMYQYHIFICKQHPITLVQINGLRELNKTGLLRALREKNEEIKRQLKAADIRNAVRGDRKVYS